MVNVCGRRVIEGANLMSKVLVPNKAWEWLESSGLDLSTAYRVEIEIDVHQPPTITVYRYVFEELTREPLSLDEFTVIEEVTPIDTRIRGQE